MSTLSTTVRRGLVITAAATAAGPGLAAVAQAATGPTTAAPIDAAPVAHAIAPAAGWTTADGATQFADMIPVGRSVPAPSLGALPLAGPLAGGLPMAGPVADMALPLLSGVTGGLPIAGPLVQGLPLVGAMMSPAHAAMAPATRSALPQGTPAVQGLATSQLTQAALPSVAGPAMSAAMSAVPPMSTVPQAATSPLSALAGGSQLPLVGSLPVTNLPLVGSVMPQVTNLLHF